MSGNEFENSRVSDGTMQPGAQHPGTTMNESRAVSRDDVRDGFAEPPSPPKDAAKPRSRKRHQAPSRARSSR